MAKSKKQSAAPRRGGQSNRAGAPQHPGVVLAQVLEDTPLSLAAKWFSLSEADVRAVLEGRAPVTAEIAAQAGAIFGTGSAPWLEMQAAYDAAKAAEAARAALQRAKALGRAAQKTQKEKKTPSDDPESQA